MIGTSRITKDYPQITLIAQTNKVGLVVLL